MAFKLYLSLLNMNLELPADAPFCTAGCGGWLVEIRYYCNIKLPDSLRVMHAQKKKNKNQKPKQNNIKKPTKTQKQAKKKPTFKISNVEAWPYSLS